MGDQHVPLPERVRPQQLHEVLGQGELLGPEGSLVKLMTTGHLPSIIFWGPPGCGKTTTARLLAAEVGMRFMPFSAVLGGVGDLRKLIGEAEQMGRLGERSLLFIDEIHRFNKAQQDALLPHVEAGTVTLVGATTENPSFSVNRALLSRCRVVTLQALDEEASRTLIQRAIAHTDGLSGCHLTDSAEANLIALCGGDGRRLLLYMEEAWAMAQPEAITDHILAQVCARTVPSHDKDGEDHYDVASAFIKSMRASDVQAALFYLARQLEAGEDPMFVARRVVIFACEDVGLADPQALVVSQSALQATHHIGMPEAMYPLTQAVIYCATAPKSNTTKSYFAAAEAVKEHPGAQVPLFLRNAPTALMTELGYKEGYQYDHDTPDHFAGQNCLPDGLTQSRFYEPGQFGFEKDIGKRMQWWDARRRQRG